MHVYSYYCYVNGTFILVVGSSLGSIYILILKSAVHGFLFYFPVAHFTNMD